MSFFVWLTGNFSPLLVKLLSCLTIFLMSPDSILRAGGLNVLTMSNNASKPIPGEFQQKLPLTTVSNETNSQQKPISEPTNSGSSRDCGTTTDDASNGTWSIKVFLN